MTSACTGMSTEESLAKNVFGQETEHKKLSAAAPQPKWLGGILPSLQRRGGCATKKMSRSLRSGADGVVAHKPYFRMRSKQLAPPRAAVREAFAALPQGSLAPVPGILSRSITA